jgi:hypothetical protein
MVQHDFLIKWLNPKNGFAKNALSADRLIR